ncbi:histidine phosphatase family protein [Streptococcus sanguinis]|uniref:histidine phosphatase family protein n=1 Tax=Streptococcus sanguinis TaxID=1305 RepID=UPI000F690AB2|nr:histidine phosphatase family protein [Streptococcus sanguinis]RSI34196.1 2,3-bisphosphoglycerate-dependent phosphoglycerate mutase [Streptococcus sanguinis]
MAKTRLYLVRHGKTMFNTIGRAQGWSDTPLTEVGERGIHELGIGLREAGLDFKLARSSDSGRTIQTMSIILEELGLTDQIPYTFDKRIREWCFGSFDGGYDGELFMGVMPRVFNIEHVHQLSYAELAEGLVEVDTAGWAENWEKLSGRIWEGFSAIAEELEAAGGGNALVVSHGMTIGTFVYLINRTQPHGLDNGSVTIVDYEDGKFTVACVGDMSYREAGAKVMEEEVEAR